MSQRCACANRYSSANVIGFTNWKFLDQFLIFILLKRKHSLIWSTIATASKCIAVGRPSINILCNTSVATSHVDLKYWQQWDRWLVPKYLNVFTSFQRYCIQLYLYIISSTLILDPWKEAYKNLHSHYMMTAIR